MDQTGTSKTRSESWKGMYAILLVAVMVAMSLSPMISAEAPEEHLVVESAPAEIIQPDVDQNEVDKSSFPALTSGANSRLTGTAVSSARMEEDHEPFQAPTPPKPLSWTPLFYDDFEDGDISDWTLAGFNNDWQIGTPSGLGGDPTSAFQGTYSIGNDMTGLGSYPGNYENNVAANTNYIFSPPIDCTGQTNVQLEFYRWFGIENSIWDHASVMVSTDMLIWNVAWTHTGGSVSDVEWIKQSLDISAWASNQPTVYIRFDMGPTDSSVVYCGWNIDMVYVGASTSGIVVFHDGFEDGDFSDWTRVGASNDWQIGTPSGLGTPPDPVGAYAGTYSIGNDITGLGTYFGEYENNVPANSNYIYTPAINCAGITGVNLEFYRWLGIENVIWDHAYIYISTDLIVWNQVWSHTGGSFSDGAWTHQNYDISAWADNQPTVYIRFDMGPTDGSVTYCGWNIDDISVYSSAISVSFCDITPDSQTEYGEPGTDITYLLTLENTGTDPASYDLSVSGNAWPTELYDIGFTGASEDFSGAFPPAGWTTSGVAIIPNGANPTWWDLYNSYTYSGPGCAGLWWSNNLQDEWLMTPEMDWSGVPAADISFWTIYNFDSATSGWPNYHNTVEVSTDGGTTWTTIADLAQDPAYRLGGAAWGPDWNAYEVPINLDLTAFAGEPSVQIAWHYWSDAAGGYAIWMVDDIQINALSTSGITDHIGPLNPGESRTFLAVVSIPSGATSGDFDVARIFANDETNPTVLDFGTLTTMVAMQTPWEDNFEDPISSWDTWDSALGTAWEWGNPAGGTGPDAAASPDNCWGTNLHTDYTVPSEAILTSPAIKLGTTDPVLIFDQWYEIDGTETTWDYEDGGWVEISDNGGITWQQLFPNGGYNDWTGDTVPDYGTNVECFAGISNGWETAVFELDPWAGDIVYLRFRFFTEQWVESNDLAGWYIDNVYVGQYPYGVDLQPDNQYAAENTGTFVYYYYTVYNTGIWTDTYDIWIDDMDWSTSIWDETFSYQFDEIGPLQPGESMSFWVVVYIPEGLAPGIIDWIEVTVTSQADPNLWDSSEIITEADPWHWFEVGPDVQTNFGWVGQWVAHSVWITNEGSEPDVYLPMFYQDMGQEWDADWWTQFYTVDLRPQGIYNGIDDGSQTWWWGPVMPGETKEYVIKVFVPTDETGAFDQARIFITSNNDGSLVKEVEIWTRLSMPAPFYDDFEEAGDEGVFGLYNDGGWLGDIYGVWQADNMDYAGVNDDTSYSGTYSMYTNGGEVTVESCTIDMDMPAGIASCVIRRGDDAFSEDPDNNEDLIVEYSDGNLQWAEWHELDTFLGSGTPGEVYFPVWVLPEDALTPRFQIRFRQTGGSGSGNDYWHIDDVYIGGGNPNFDFSPNWQNKMGSAGSTVTYNFDITNYAIHSDIFDVYIENNAWDTYGPWQVGPIGPGMTASFSINVEIPSEAIPGDTDTAQVYASPVMWPWYTQMSTITTTVGRVHNIDQDTWYMNIQPAINAANPGDHIEALESTYYEHIVVDKPLTITGQNTETTIIDGSKSLGSGETNTIMSAFVPNVLLLHADQGGEPLRTQLLTLGGLGTVDAFDARNLMPTLSQLMAYDTVIAWSNYQYFDYVAIGNLLADYVDAGGKVINMEFAIDPNWGMAGRFITEQYTAMNCGACIYTTSSLGTYNTAHPIMQGVTAASDVYRAGGTSLATGSTEIARWADGELFIAAKDDKSVVTINCYPGTYLQWTGQVDRAIHNAIKWQLTDIFAPLATITSNGVHFSDFTLQNEELGILMDGVSGCDIGNNIIQNCGGGISLKDSGGNHIHDNEISNNAGGSFLPNSLETIFPGGNSQDGNMFDVTAGANEITIRSFDCNINGNGVNTAEVYYKEGSYAGFDTYSPAWTLLGTEEVTGIGVGTPVNVPIGGLTIPAGETYGLYVTLLNTDPNNLAYTNGANVYSNSDITITTGVGKQYPFGTTYTPRTWNGRIHYTIENTGPGIHIEGFGYPTFDDDFSADTGLWTYDGIATRTGGYCQLTPTSYGQVGRALYNSQVNSPFVAEFDFLAGGGNGADGMALNFFKEAYTPVGGGYIGVVDADGITSGYAIEFDNYNNDGAEPSANHIALTYNGVPNGVVNHLALVNDGRTEDNVWHHVKAIVTGSGVTVYVDDMVAPVLTYVGALDMTYGGFSFSAGTGGLMNNHFVDNIHVEIMNPANLIENNRIHNNEVGILLWDADGNNIFHNNLINNGIHAIDNGNDNNWDGGYPTGGNYWSGFTGPDTNRGPTQSEPGSDGIIDFPYVIDADSQDNYPLKNMYTPTGIVIDPITVVEEPAPGEEPAAEPVPGPSTSGTPVEPVVLPEATPESAPVAPEPDATDSDAALPVEEPAMTIPDEPLPNTVIEPEIIQETESNPIWLGLLAVCSMAVAVALYFRKRI